MMKSIMTLALGISMIIGTNSQQKKTDLEKENLNGQVKYIKETTYYTNEKEKKDKIFSEDYTLFNEKGYIIEKRQITYFGNFNKFYKYIYVYDEHNNIIEYYGYSEEDKLTLKKYFLYDKQNRVIEEKIYNPEFAKKITYHYNENDNNTTIKYYNADGSLIEKVPVPTMPIPIYEEFDYTYNYDKRNNWIKKVGYKNKYPLYI